MAGPLPGHRQIRATAPRPPWSVLTDEPLKALDQAVPKCPDATLEELQRMNPIEGSIMVVKRALDRLGYCYKKTLRANEQDREEVRQQRAEWLAALPAWDSSRLVFVDETGAKTNLTRRRGRSRNGSRRFAKVPFGHGCTTTLISSIRLEGTTAAREIGGATDASVFREYARHVLAPTLSPGDMVVLDNLRAHEDAPVVGLIEAQGASVKFLPPYSPNLNIIEKLWKHVKQARLKNTYYEDFDSFGGAIDDEIQKVNTTFRDELGSLFTLNFQILNINQEGIL